MFLSMSIRVTGIDSHGHIVHDYANGVTVTVQADGTLLVMGRPSGTNSARPLGAYPPGKWTNAFNTNELTDASE